MAGQPPPLLPPFHPEHSPSRDRPRCPRPCPQRLSGGGVRRPARDAQRSGPALPQDDIRTKTGGIDRRLAEVFYGSRPIDAVTELMGREGRDPFLREQSVEEHGARLTYQRMDNGIVLVGLHPAGSEGSRRREQMVQLEWIRGSHALTGSGTLERHWRAFVAYMECTSLEGEPTPGDRLRVWWLLFVRPTIVDGKHSTALCWLVSATVVKFALTIGLSGFLLAVITGLVTTPTPPCPCR